VKSPSHQQKIAAVSWGLSRSGRVTRYPEKASAPRLRPLYEYDDLPGTRRIQYGPPNEWLPRLDCDDGYEWAVTYGILEVGRLLTPVLDSTR